MSKCFLCCGYSRLNTAVPGTGNVRHRAGVSIDQSESGDEISSAVIIHYPEQRLKSRLKRRHRRPAGEYPQSIRCRSNTGYPCLACAPATLRPLNITSTGGHDRNGNDDDDHQRAIERSTFDIRRSKLYMNWLSIYARPSWLFPLFTAASLFLKPSPAILMALSRRSA